MTTEVFCRKCSTHGLIKRKLMEQEQCPNCDAPLYKRRAQSPTPWNSMGSVSRALLSIRALLFIGVYAMLTELPHPFLRLAVAVLLFLAASAFAGRAMAVGRDGYIEFPHVSFDELLSIRAIFAMSVYVLVLVLGPILLIGSSLAASYASVDIPFMPPVPVAIGLALLLFLWSPMALVLYLRTQSVLGFFLVPQGIRLILTNVTGYLGLCAIVLVAQGALAGVYLINSVIPFPATLLMSVLKAMLVLSAYASAGLYIRQHARVLDFPVDDDDWMPVAPPVDVSRSDYRTFRPTDPKRAIELDATPIPLPPGILSSSQTAFPAPPSMHDRTHDRMNDVMNRGPNFDIESRRISTQAASVGLAPLEEGEWLSAPGDEVIIGETIHVARPAGTATPSDGNPSFSQVQSQSAFDDDTAQDDVGVRPLSDVPTQTGVHLDVDTRSPASLPSTPTTKQLFSAQVHPPLESAETIPGGVRAREASFAPANPSPPGTGAKPSPSSTLPSLQLGRYRLVSKIAEGGMAEIYRAFQEGPSDYKKEVIVKRMRASLATQPEVLEMFLDEARLGAQLNHPNIVQVIDFGEANGEYFIAMEYLEGGDLGEILKKNPIPIDVAALIISEACAGLHFAHSLIDEAGMPRGVVHRDISPANIFVAQPGVVKVLDFGIASATDRSTKTKAGMIKGKPPFMSPEQVRGQPLDGRSDVFSLGVTMTQLITGENPFHRESDFDSGAAIVQEHAPPLADSSIVVPLGFEDVLKGALRKHASNRFASAAEFAVALRPFLPQQPAHEVLSRLLGARLP